MELHLRYPPTLEFASLHAQVAVDAVRNVDGIELDYSSASLVHIDRILLGFHEEGLSETQIGETVFSLGCYAGEVFVRQAEATWVAAEDVVARQLLPEGAAFPLVQLPSGDAWNPITKAFKRLEAGETESLAYLYDAALSR